MSYYVESDIREIVERLGDDAQMLAGRRILLCGGLGFLGRYFLEVFKYLNAHTVAAPCQLVVVDNGITSGTFGATLSHEGYQLLAHDICQPLPDLGPFDYIIHAAGIASPYYYRKYPVETLEVAIVGTKNLLTMCTVCPPRGFLFFSSSEIYGNPDDTHVPIPETYRGNVSCTGPRACYDESKRVGETLCVTFHQVYRTPVTIVRPFNIYGPGMQQADHRVLPNFASDIVTRQPLQVYSSGTQTRTFCYITDALVGFLLVLLKGRPPESYNIGNTSPEVSMLELAHLLEEVVGRKLQIELTAYPDTYPPEESRRRCPDIRKAQLQVGYTPIITLRDGLQRFMDWALAHYTKSQTKSLDSPNG